MKADGEAISYVERPAITGIMMVGLQGAGKTTTAGKLARHLEKLGKRPMLVAADLQRPGAIEQLIVLGERVQVPVFSMRDVTPFEVCAKAQAEARKLKCDTIIYDTAGRLAIDEALMGELVEIKARVRPQNILLVIDAMTGQDSVKTASTLHEKLSLTGVVLTKLDGDARGGAALSVKEVTGAPIRFVGMGEGLDRLEEFRARAWPPHPGSATRRPRGLRRVVDQARPRPTPSGCCGPVHFDDSSSRFSMFALDGPLQACSRSCRSSRTACPRLSGR